MFQRLIFLSVLCLFSEATSSLAQAPKKVMAPKSVSKLPAKGSVDFKVDSVLKLMTLDEKIGQLNLLTSDMDQTGASMRPQYKEDIRKGYVGAVFNAYGVDYVRKLQKMVMEETRLKIPLIFGYDVIHGHRTIFPSPLGESCSWDLEAMETSARIAALEAASMGLDWTFAPMVDIARDPRWGRVMEGAGEDTYLGSLIAKARVKGFQGSSLSDPTRVMACAKHYAAYGAAQAGRDYSTVDMSDRTLRDIYLPPFKAASDAGAATFMTSFNELNGIPATANKYLMDEILRKEWGFKGFVVTDYTAIWELLFHGIAADSVEAVKKSILAGVDMDMQASMYTHRLPGLVKSGAVPVSVIDESVRRVLRKKFELGLFANPYIRMDAEREKKNVLTAAHLNMARQIAAKSMVLLKNDHNTLPLKLTAQKIALVGPLADAARDMMGAWSAAGDGDRNVTLLTGLKGSLTSSQVEYKKGCEINDTVRSGFAEALTACANSDIVICAMGEGAWQSGEAASRSDIKLPGVQEAFLAEVKKLGKPVVLVLFNGRPLDLTNVLPNADAILEAWYPGSMAGWAVTDVLAGVVNPSAKITMTFPRNVGQVPIFYNMKNTGRPYDANNKYTSKYLDVRNDPLFAFGYGLSYSTFVYSSPKLSTHSIGMKDTLKVTVNVKNTSTRHGEEIVQLYVQDMAGSVTRPVNELKGFQKVLINAGETKTLVFKLTSNDLKFYNQDMNFAAEKGLFTVRVGGSSDATQSDEFELR
ncbi:MAG TPA: glycoside hydrolase family 3 N-terminal domain-containing protein [Catalimonadaceae bacterium]|nr:glycoside hydrolase family 3 N-terminal domain-containing protein [Catalimonadaceae bacterium]